MKNQKIKAFLFNSPVCEKIPNATTQLLRIIISDDYTRIDFGYISTGYYIKGGWVRISPKTFFRNCKTHEIFPLTKADNIPLSPNKFEFKTTIDWLYYSLYFPTMPIEDLIIDVIESEPQTPTTFNFYGVKLLKKDAIEIII